MGLFAAIGAAIVGAVTAIGSAISSIAATIGPAIASFASKLVGLVARIPGLDTIEKIFKAISIISDIFKAVLKVLGVDQKDEAEKTGYKAAHSDKKRSDFESASEYIDYLNKQELTPEQQAEYDNLSAKDKVKYAAVGTSIEGAAISEITGLEITPEMTAALYKVNDIIDLKEIPEKLIELINLFRKSGITDTNVIIRYLEGTTSAKNDAVENSFKKAGVGDDLMGRLKEGLNGVRTAFTKDK